MGRNEPRGQVLVIAAFAFAVIVMLLALVFDGAQGLVTRRTLQNTSDAAALAGANILQAVNPRGCSASFGPPPGAPQASVVAAVKASVASNLPGYDLSKVVVTCPPGWDNAEVRVQLTASVPSFFGGIFGRDSLPVRSSSGAVNGQSSASAYSVIELDPSNLTWPNGRKGCPSFLLSGGPTAKFDSAIYLNSTCKAVNGGALSTNGNASNLTMSPGAQIRIVGEYKPAALTITPPPLNNQKAKPDPLAWLPDPVISSMPVRSNAKLTQNGGTILLQPGVYKGGIQLKSSAKAYLKPGIYVINGGGLDLGAQTEVYSINASKASTTASNWAADCTPSACGVLIYNTGTASGGTAMDQIKVAAGSVLKMRAYNPDADTSAFKTEAYRNLLIWQTAAPVPTSTYEQPMLALSGGGGVEMSGTVYAPSAKVQMGGGSGGSGGGPVDLTLQFVSWDLELSGNSSFYFRYNANAFTRPLDYGLIE